MTTIRNGSDVVEHPIGERGELILRLPSGRVDVTGVDGHVATVRDLDGRDLDRFIIERSDGHLGVRPRDRVVFDIGIGRRGQGSARLAVEVPRHATVSLDTANGVLVATGLHGDQRYRTASGDITVTDASGPIAIDAVSGTARLDAVGPVELSGRLVSGDLALRGGSLRSVALATTSGDIELDSPIEGPGPFNIQTVSGDARVAAAGGGLRVEARTLTGEIASDVGPRSETGIGRRVLVIGNGARTLTFKSISGDLRIAAHAALPALSPPPAPKPPVAPEPADGAMAAASQPVGDERLAVLRDLESGVIDIATATERLAALEDRTDG